MVADSVQGVVLHLGGLARGLSLLTVQIQHHRKMLHRGGRVILKLISKKNMIEECGLGSSGLG